MCIPTQRCYRQTPVGEVEGMECPPGNEVYHNTTIDSAKRIAEEGEFKVVKKEALGQDAISFSSCPGQRFGGNIKLAVDPTGLNMRPMCYYDHEKEKKIDRWIGSQHEMNRIRAKYAVDAAVLHQQECENISYDPVPAKAIKRLEYWIPWRIEDSYPTMGCEGAMPHYSFSERYLSDPVKKVHDNIAEARDVAKKLGADFRVKSCFTALKTGWGDQYIPLNDHTLNMLARGKSPKIVDGKVPQLCRCQALTNGGKTQRFKTDGWEAINYDVGGDSCELKERKGPFYNWQCHAGGWNPSEAIVDCRDKKLHTMTGGVYHELISKNADTEKAELNDDGSRFLRLRWHPSTKEYATFPTGPEGELSLYTVTKVYPHTMGSETIQKKQDKCLCELGRSGLLDMGLDVRSYTQRYGQERHVNVRNRCARSRD